MFHDLAEGMLNTRHSAIDRRLVVGSVFICFVLHTCMYMILVRGWGYTIKDICADQDVCLMFKQFKKL